MKKIQKLSKTSYSINVLPAFCNIVGVPCRETDCEEFHSSLPVLVLKRRSAIFACAQRVLGEGIPRNEWVTMRNELFRVPWNAQTTTSVS